MGKAFFYIFVLPFLYFLSIWPFWLLYAFSTFLFFVVYRLIGYRKKVVFENLKNAFPEKSEEERKEIAVQFYRHFCDLIVEIVKLLTISRESFSRHFRFDEEAKKVFSKYEEKGQTVVGVLGHCGNWEWCAVAYPVYFKHLLTAVYHPLSNKQFDALMLKIRSRFGGNMVPMNHIYREMLGLREKKTPTILGLIADQTPPPESAQWVKFLNQDTPVFNGPEKIARRFNYPLLYVPLRKIKRGLYEMSAVVISDEPNTVPEGKLTELHVAALENNIKEQPFNWLWTHKRWKHKRPLN